MSQKYKKPSLCDFYCSNDCAIGCFIGQVKCYIDIVYEYHPHFKEV